MNIIAIDCGASFLKGARINEYGVIERVIIKDSPKVSFNLSEKTIIWKVQTIKNIIFDLTEGLKEVKVCISNEMHGFVVADEKGNPYIDYVSWQNECAYERYGKLNYLETVSQWLSQEEVLATGMPLKAGLPNVNLFYVLRNQLKDIKTEKIYFYTLGDYIIRVLTGMQPYIHASNAAATGLYDMHVGTWNERILEKLGMQGIHFPEISEAEGPITTIIDGICMHFYSAIGDQQAALLGSGVLEEESLSVNLGTGGQVSRVSGRLELSNDYQTRPYFNGYYLKTIPHIPSGRAINVYFGFIKEIISHFVSVEDKEIWSYVIQQAEAAPAEDLGVDMSFFTNAVTNHTQGSITNITENNFNCGSFFRSVYRQMADNVRVLAERVGNATIKKVIFSGGVVTKNKLLRDFILENFSDIEEISVSENETLIGLFEYVQLVDKSKGAI